MLRQAFAHCAKFPTAASRRSLGRVSVPVWLIVLSDQLPVVALVGHYPTNKLIGRETLPDQNPFVTKGCPPVTVSGISSGFLELSQSLGQVSHVLLTRSPLELHQCCHWMTLARLACVKHAASVRPEPGSNSPSKPCLSERTRFERSCLRAGAVLSRRTTCVASLFTRGCSLRRSLNRHGSTKTGLTRCWFPRTSRFRPLFRFQGTRSI